MGAAIRSRGGPPPPLRPLTTNFQGLGSGHPYFKAIPATAAFDGPHALGAAAFAGFPALEELDLSEMVLGEAAARLLTSRRWARLRKLNLRSTQLGDAGLAALARGDFPALTWLDLCWNGIRAPPTLEDARRWAPALKTLHATQ